MILPFFQVDAFAPRPLTGNPAAVMPLEEWLPDEQLQAIAGRIPGLGAHADKIPDNIGDTLGGAARWWLHGSLDALARKLERQGSRLILRRETIEDLLSLEVQP